jgi:hypothetical protein
MNNLHSKSWAVNRPADPNCTTCHPEIAGLTEVCPACIHELDTALRAAWLAKQLGVPLRDQKNGDTTE